MKRLSLRDSADGLPLRVVAIGAHADDIEIGCAGTLLRLAGEHGSLEVDWVILTALAERREEALLSARSLLPDSSEVRVTVHDFRDGHLPWQASEVKDTLARLRDSVTPDIVFTHHRGDAHQDHRLLGELAWQLYRDQLILEYEVPKYDGDLGVPNVLVTLSEEVAARKVAHLMSAFPSQRDRGWYSEDTLRGVMRLRGLESNSVSGWAEAFYCRKLVI